MNELISVIVPVYKAEMYLHACVNSILNQTYKNLEIILVDDGSPDGCPIICDEYAEKDSRVKVIHQKNGGVSKARNAAISVANGDYIGFVDADDWIEPKMFEVLYDMIQSTDSDMSIVSFTLDDFPNNNYGCESEIQMMSALEARIEMHRGTLFGGHMWNKLVRRAVFPQTRQVFPEGITICEDLAVSGSLLMNCERIAYKPYKAYHYIQRPTSALHQLVKESDWSVQIACEIMCDQMRSVSPENMKYAYMTYIGQDITLAMRLNRAKQLDSTNYKRLRNSIIKHYSKETKKVMPRGIRIRTIAFLAGKRVFTIINKLLRLRINALKIKT